MNVQILAKKMTLSHDFDDYAEKKLAKLDKFFDKDANARIVLTEIKNEIIVEVTIKYNQMLFRAECQAPDKMDALDRDIDLITRQIRKNKTKVAKKIKSAPLAEYAVEEPENEINITRHKRFVMHPMTEDEAVLQMELLGHTFFMFENAETGEINVVYKRNSGSYAVLIPEDE